MDLLKTLRQFAGSILFERGLILIALWQVRKTVELPVHLAGQITCQDIRSFLLQRETRGLLFLSWKSKA